MIEFALLLLNWLVMIWLLYILTRQRSGQSATRSQADCTDGTIFAMQARRR